jgi:hypothetical protein
MRVEDWVPALKQMGRIGRQPKVEKIDGFPMNLSQPFPSCWKEVLLNFLNPAGPPLRFPWETSLASSLRVLKAGLSSVAPWNLANRQTAFEQFVDGLNFREGRRYTVNDISGKWSEVVSGEEPFGPEEYPESQMDFSLKTI